MKLAIVHRGTRGFTIVELLVVLVILFVLCSILLPPIAWSGPRRDPQRSRCITNLKQLGVASLMYAQDHAGLLPWQAYSIVGQTNSARRLISPNLSARQYLDHFTNYTGNSPKLFLCPADMERGQNVSTNPPVAGNHGISYFVALNTYHDQASVPMLGDRSISPAPGKPLYSSVKGRPVLVDTNTSIWSVSKANKFHDGQGVFAFTDGHVEWAPSPAFLLSFATQEGATNANQFLFPQ